MIRTLAFGAALAAALAVVVPSASGAKAAKPASSSGTAFTNFSIAETPGIACPGSSSCSNIASEPAIRADGDGNFFGSTENGLGGGTVAVRSTDGGLHYLTLQSPNGVSSANDTGFAPGGGDTDLATAPARNAQGNFNVYVASLSLANVDVSTSTDRGQTWTLNPVSATIAGDDREWIAADGASKVCISYHDVATFNLDVNCSLDAGTTFTQLGDAIDAAHAYQINDNESGNLAIDPSSHVIYQAYSAITSSSEAVGAGFHGEYMGVSTDGGKTFTDYPVYVNPDSSVSYGSQFANVSVDRAGNVYDVYTDGHDVYYSFSTDHGQTWSGPFKLNSGGTAIMPWATAGDAGKLDVVWYQTSYRDTSTTADNYPDSAAWTVTFAQGLTATTAGSSFTRTTATPVVHTGGVCLSGVTCTGNRDLFDDFGVAASPVTGLASVIYSDDQYSSSGPNSSGCGPSQNNSGSCDHTAIATQTGGTGIFGSTSTAKKKKP
ncbi:MAG TPA: sialidase family protein [Gaiellaceae bacterium]|nr:sialidase family protein [Gaiellaceae bacterium]